MPDIDDDLIIRSLAALGEDRERYAARVAALEELARDMLGHFVKVSDGYRARAGQVQIAKWQEQLGDGDA